MIIRQDFQETPLPPRDYLLQICDTHTEIYCFLWENQDKEGKVSMTWKEATQHYNRNTFRTATRKLCAKGLASVAEDLNGFTIELTGWS